MKNLSKISMYLLCGILVLLNACSKDDDTVSPPPPTMPNPSEINEHVQNLPSPNQPNEIQSPVLTNTTTEDLNGLSCTVRTYQWAPGYPESILLDPTSDVIWLGSILQGSSITTGAYTPVVANRKPMTFSTDIENLEDVSKPVENPNLATVRQAISELLAQKFTGELSSSMAFSVKEIHSSNQLRLSINGNYDGLFTDVNAQFNFNNTQIKSRYLVQFTQVFYSLDLNLPASPADMLYEIPDNLGTHTPVYVSSMKYGRMAMLAFESTKEASELQAAIEASFNALISSGGLEFEAGHESTWNSTSFKALAVGDSNHDILIEGISGLKTWVQDGTDYDENSAAAPLAYTLRFLSDNAIAKVILSGEYQVRDCEVLPVTYTETIKINNNNFQTICPNHIGGNREFSGNGPVETANAQLYTQNNDKELWVRIYFNVKETVSDWTEGETTIERKIYTAENNFHISQINSDTYSSCEGIDNDHSLNFYNQGQSELVERFEIMGDGDGTDLPANNNSNPDCENHYAYLNVLFNPVELTIQEN